MIYLSVIPVVILIDHLTKFLIVSNLTETFAVIPNVLYLLYTTNTGAAFSMFSGNNFVMLCITLAIELVIVVYSIKVKPYNRIDILARALVIGGAAGNIIDRIIRGHVVDFVYFSPINFPVFNFADTCICIGTLLYLLIYIKHGTKEVREVNEPA